MFLILIPFYILLFFVVASMAKERGRDKTEYVLLAVLLSPLFAIIVLLIKGYTEDRRREKIIADEEIRSAVKHDNTTSTNAQVSSVNKYQNLERLGNLFEKGLITKEEFDREKQYILSDNVITKNEAIQTAAIEINEQQWEEELQNPPSNSTETQDYEPAGPVDPLIYIIVALVIIAIVFLLYLFIA